MLIRLLRPWKDLGKRGDEVEVKGEFGCALASGGTAEILRYDPMPKVEKVGRQDVNATDEARLLAAEERVRLTKVHGTGPGAVITEDDVRRAISSGDVEILIEDEVLDDDENIHREE